jgi:hypothetical protein
MALAIVEPPTKNNKPSPMNFTKPFGNDHFVQKELSMKMKTNHMAVDGNPGSWLCKVDK